MLYSPEWTNTGVSFILLTVNLFRHSTLIEQGLYKGLRIRLFIIYFKGSQIRISDYIFLSLNVVLS